VPPDPADPTSFPRYLRRMGRRWRSLSGTGVRYESTMVLLWYGTVPAIVGVQALTAPAPPEAPLTWPAATALLLAAAAAVVLVAVAAGPVNVGPEYRSWVLSTPVDRGVLLRRPCVRAIGMTAVVVGLVGLAAAGLAGLRGAEALAATGLAAGLGAVAGSVAVLGQAAGAHRSMVVVARWVAVVLFVGAGVLNPRPMHPPPGPLLWVVAAAAAGVAAVLGRAAVRAAAHIPLARMTAGSGPVASVTEAVSDQTLAPLSEILLRPELRRQPVRVGHRLSGTGAGALAAVDRRLGVRNLQAAGRWVLLVAVAYLASPLLEPAPFGRAGLALVAYLSAIGAVSGYCDTVRRFAAEPTLADRYGLDRWPGRLAAMRVPVLAGALFALATLPLLAGTLGPLRAIWVPLLALLVAAYRANQRPFAASFVVGSTYSQDVVRRFLRGPGMLLAGGMLVMAGLLGG
jgi:hypothetical protein